MILKYPLVATFVFIFGLILGSFLNVVIYRLPRNIKFGLARSACPNCNKLIFWYENVPIISYIFLEGNCSGCRSKISLRYPFVEFLMGLVSLWLFPNMIKEVNLLLYLVNFSTFSIILCQVFIYIDSRKIVKSLLISLMVLIAIYSSIFLYDFA